MKKMKLNDLKVKSFTTSIDNAQEVKGGGGTPLTIIIVTVLLCRTITQTIGVDVPTMPTVPTVPTEPDTTGPTG